MNDYTIKHLEFIHDTITRLNANSFHVKALSIMILTTLLGICVSLKKTSYFLVSISPFALFWFLDAYYLQQERKFRGIYNDVAGLSNDKVRIIVREFEMPIEQYTCGKYSYLEVFWSKTIWPFYLLPILLLLVIGYIFSQGYFLNVGSA
jgi:hypothetical protein